MGRSLESWALLTLTLPGAALLSLCLQHLLGGLVNHHLHHDDALQSAGTQCPAGKKHGCSMGAVGLESKQVLT